MRKDIQIKFLYFHELNFLNFNFFKIIFLLILTNNLMDRDLQLYMSQLSYFRLVKRLIFGLI